MTAHDVAEQLEPRAAASGELGLLAALLTQAIADARAGRADAVAWIASDAVTARGGFAFVQVCRELALDPAWVRQQVSAGVQARRVAMRRGPRRLRAAA